MTKKQEEAIKNAPQEGFHFDSDAHLYVLDGKPLTGVTTILSVIAKPALIQWSADEAVKHLGWYNEKYITEDTKDLATTFLGSQLDMIKQMDADTYFKFLCEARTKHAQRKKDAGVVGTDVHAEIENLVKTAISTSGKIPLGTLHTNEIVNKFILWATENDITFLASEKRLYSRQFWYAGTCDLVFMQNGKKRIGDIKTSSGIYGREFFAQMAGYQLALEEMGEIQKDEIEARTIIRCGKDGSFEVKDSFDYATDLSIFLACVQLYRGLETF